MQKLLEKPERSAQRISVGELGLNISGKLRLCREQEMPLLITTRREVTHVILPLSLTSAAGTKDDDHVVNDVITKYDNNNTQCPQELHQPIAKEDQKDVREEY